MMKSLRIERPEGQLPLLLRARIALSYLSPFRKWCIPS
jgi:hypothetical protein